MKNQGISLIALIITIIVIIILAAIVIFTGLNTPDSANFAHFCQDVDNVYSAVFNQYGELYTKHATANQTRTSEQIYIEIATGTDPDQYAAMNGVSAPLSVSGELQTTTKYCQNLDPNNSKVKGVLPLVRESKNAWYVAQNGQVFNATGYSYTIDGKIYTYFTANARTQADLGATSDTYETRAVKIAKALCEVEGDYTALTGME